MKRPLAYVGFSFVLSLIIAVAFGYAAAAACAGVCAAVGAVLLLVLLLREEKRLLPAVVCMFSAGIALALYALTAALYVNPIIEEYDGREVYFEGQIASAPYTDSGTTSFYVKTSSVDGEARSLKLAIKTNYVTDAELYDYISGSAQLYSLYESGYGYGSYCAARSIFLGAYINIYYDSWYSVEKCGNKPLYSVFSSLRETMSNKLFEYLDYDTASLCVSIITGERSYLSDDVYSSFRTLGVSHMLVVSGMHLSIVAAVLSMIFGRVFRNKRYSAIAQMIGVLCFMALASFGFSVTRAGIMTFVLLLSNMFRSRADTLNSLGLAVLLICLNPLSAGDIGLLWSFSCTLSIALFANKLRRYLTKTFRARNRVPRGVLAAVSAAIAGTAGSLPFIIFVTGTISPYSIIVNLLIVPFTGIIIVCGGLGAVMFALHMGVIAYPLLYVCGIVAKYVLLVVRFFSGLPLASASMSEAVVYVWFTVAVIIALAVYFFDKKRKLTAAAVAAAVALLVLIYSIDYLVTADDITLSVLDVGSGMSVVLKSDGKAAVLSSYGEKYQYSTISDELDGYDVLCAADISPGDADYSYCKSIAAEYSVPEIFVNAEDKLQTYSYLCYKGAVAELLTVKYELSCIDGTRTELITVDGYTWEYVTVYNTTILICPYGCDIALLDEEYREPDIAVIGDMPESFDLLGAGCIVVSDYSDECAITEEILIDYGCEYICTGGSGRVDISFSNADSVSISRTDTGGVTRYGTDE